MKCPGCFVHLPPTPLQLVCVGTCQPQVLASAVAFKGFETRSRPILAVAVPRDGSPPDPQPTLTCPECRVPTRQEACPGCAYPIPAHWRQSMVTCVAMAGARATGKSLMLAVAKEQLELLAERFHNSHFEAIGDTEAFFQRNYTEPLFGKRRMLEATASASTEDALPREPMLFQFTETGPHGPRNRILVLRDVAGEDLEMLGEQDSYLTFFSRADAVIALLDPLVVPQISALLANLIPSTTRLGGDGIRVLRHVLNLMNGHRMGAQTDIPLAVVLSKFDVIQELRRVQGTEWAKIMNRPGSAMQRDPSLMSPLYDTQDGDLLQAEVLGLLERMNAQTLHSTVAQSARNFRFFAVSALGGSPDGDILNAGGIAPFRVTDPFKWALQTHAGMLDAAVAQSGNQVRRR